MNGTLGFKISIIRGTQMLLSLEMEDVRTNGVVIREFHSQSVPSTAPVMRTSLSGKNGVGKTTVLEALCFAFTGRDSSGGQCPIHLIARDKESMKVTLTLDWGSIVRTLTRKKNGTLKLVRQNIAFYPTQTEFREQHLCHQEGVFLAATVPGYLMTQAADRRLALIAEVTPRFDRYEILATLSGIPLEDIRKFGSVDKNIPHYTHFSFRRIELQKQVARNLGQIDIYRDALHAEIEEPVRPAQQLALLDLMGIEMGTLRKYQEELLSFPQKKNLYDSILQENENRQKQALYLTEEISKIAFEEELPVNYSQFVNLSLPLRELPQKPAYYDVPEFDDCPTCGQTVGEAHKTRMREANKKMYEEFDFKKEEINAHNKKITNLKEADKALLDEIMNENMARKEANKYKTNLKMQMIQQLSTCKPVTLPPEPVIPQEPKIAYSKSEFSRLTSVKEDYYKELGAYERLVKSRQVAQSNINDLNRENMELKEQIIQYERYEDAIRKLPVEEAKLKKEFFQLRNFVVDMSEGVAITSISFGVPYECLSSGERLLADFEICLQFHMLMKTAPGYIFLDNSDLADWVDKIEMPSGVQLLVASVDPDQDALVINNT